MSEPTILSVEGLGYSGSGAVLDLLKEVEHFFVMPREFRLINDPDGLLSLESSLLDNWTIFQSDLAIKRFRKLCNSLNKKYKTPYATLEHEKIFDYKFIDAVDRYLKNLTDFQYKGLWYGIDNNLIRAINKVQFIRKNRFLAKDIYVSKKMNLEEFLGYTRAFILELINICLMKYNCNNFAFDGDYSAMNPKKVTQYIPNSKIILVIRDPKDIAATTKSGLCLFAPRKLEKIIKWISHLYLRLKQVKDGIPEERMLVIKFEDLVLNYEKALPKLFKYIGIDEKHHKKKRTYFNPDISRKNIGIWKKYLSDKEGKYIDQCCKDIYDSFQNL